MNVRVPVVLALGCILLAGCDNTFEESATRPSAETVRQYVEKGWLPHGVPVAMSALKVSGDTDAERFVAGFSSDSADAYLATCSRTNDGFALESSLPKWFPKEVREASSSDALRRQGYATYTCEDDFAAVRKGADHTVWLWSDREDDD